MLGCMPMGARGQFQGPFEVSMGASNQRQNRTKGAHHASAHRKDSGLNSADTDTAADSRDNSR